MNYRPAGSRREFLELLGQLDDPAFIRRARQVESAEKALLARCRERREQLLRFPKMHLAILGVMVDFHWSQLSLYLQQDRDATRLQELHDSWQPVLRSRVDVTASRVKIRQRLRDLARSFEVFNRKWQQYVERTDLTAVNKARHDYNRYYVIEKACAFQSEQIGREGFQPLEPLTHDAITVQLPSLEVPQVV